MSNPDPNCLSYWFPKIEAAGLPVPRTKIFRLTGRAMDQFLETLDGEAQEWTVIREFAKSLDDAAAEFGYPAFLRTGQTSDKHSWRETCYIEKPGQMRDHILRLIEFSECADIIGPDWGTWAVREMLPTVPVARCTAYGDMPLCREFRAFVDGTNVLCVHPYWPLDAIQQGKPVFTRVDFDYKAFCLLDEADTDVIDLAGAAGHACGGEWSVDILHTERGWYVTDMAAAHRSWHWPDCPQAVGIQTRRQVEETKRSRQP